MRVHALSAAFDVVYVRQLDAARTLVDHLCASGRNRAPSCPTQSLQLSIALIPAKRPRVRWQEQQGVNFMYLSALLTSAWLEAEVVPPPFALLGLPYVIFAWVCGKLRALSFKKLEEQGADADSRATPAVEMPSLEELKGSMMAYIEERAGQQGEDDKWRTSLAKQSAQLAMQVADIKREQARQGEALAKALAKVSEQQAEQMKMLQEKVKA